MNDLVSLSELFDRNIFRIPDYQRGYAWSTPQLEDFWEDILSLREDKNHYTGMLSLKELKESDYKDWSEEKWILKEKKYKAFHVVDGQQRLTTFVIFVNCILSYAKSNGITYLNGDDLEEIKSRYIVEYKKPEKILKAYKFGYETDNPSFDFLRYSILEESSPGNLVESFYTLNLENAKRFFDLRLDSLFKEKGRSGLEDIFKKLINQMQFNIYYIDNDFDVHVAFETMNNRGKKLSNLEILKNRLLYLTTIFDDSVLDCDAKSQLRKDINDAWKEVYFELGRNKKNPLNDDAYLQNHWTLFFKYTRNKGDDYIKFLLDQHFTSKAVYGLKRNVVFDDSFENDDEDVRINEFVDLGIDFRLTPIEIKEYVQSLKSVAKHWYYSFNPEQSSNMTADEIVWIQRLNRIGINYFRTLVVASFINQSVTIDQRVRLFKVIEKTIFLFFRMAKWQSSYQNTVSYNFARELMKGEIDVETIISSLEESFKNNMVEVTDIFVNNISTLFKNNDGYYSWKPLKYFLFEYEMSLYEKTSVPRLTDWDAFTKSEKDCISIEHIFPQTPTNYYWCNQFRDYKSAEERHHLTNSLGNLLALSQSVNSVLQNDEYEQKRRGNNKRQRGYINGSHSEVEVATNYNDWTPKSIKDRGLHLLEFMEERWDIKFKDFPTKLKALGLDFMMQERPESKELDKPDNTIRDEHVKEYLDNREPEMVDLYNAFIRNIHEQIEGLTEVATQSYIYLKDKINMTIAKIKIQKSQIRLNIHEPIVETIGNGRSSFNSSNYSLEYRVFIKKEDDIPEIVKCIIDEMENG